MQILRRNQPERLWAQFRDEDYQIVEPSGSVYVTIQNETGKTYIANALATEAEPGKYFYSITPNNAWTYGYYGVWWKNDQGTGLSITQDIPNVFKLEDPREGIVKGVMMERVRSMLYMHTDSYGYVNKFPRDRELLDYLQESLNWWNAHPPAITFHNFIALPPPYYSIVEEGAIVKALEALGIYEAGKHFIYNDNGLSMTRDRTAKYQATWAPLLQNYITRLEKMRTKYAMDHVTMRGQFSSTTGFPRSLSRALRGVQKFM